MFNLPALRKKSAELSPFLLTSFTHIRYKIYTSGKVLAPFLPWRADYGPGVVAPRAPKKARAQVQSHTVGLASLCR